MKTCNNMIRPGDGLFMNLQKTNISVAVDADITNLATQILERMGLDQTTAIDMFFRQIIAERRLPFQPKPMQTCGEQVLDIIKRKNIPHKTVNVSPDGHILVDKDQDPDLYDWAVNG